MLVNLKSDIVNNFNLIFNELQDELNDFLSGRYDINKYLRPIEIHKFFPAIDIIPVDTNISDMAIEGHRGVSHNFTILLIEQIQLPKFTEPMIERLDEVVNLIESMRDNEKQIMNYCDDLKITNIKYSFEQVENLVIHVTEIKLEIENSSL